MADADEGSMEPVIMSDEEDDVDDSVHKKLISSIQSLDGKKKDRKAIRGIPIAPNNLDLAVHANRDSSKITVEDLEIKRGHGTQLKKPMSSGELELAKRKIARDTMAKDAGKWDPIVKEIRKAPQMKYTKQEHGLALYKTLRPKQFIPRTPLEQELYAALGKSEDVLKPNKELTEAEEKALKAMSIQEARARRAELMKHHELLSRMQLKAKRLKRIKSKRYRKILRKEKEANDKKELEQLQKTDPEAFFERMEQLDRARMEERLTLKHRGGGKFSRLHKAYSKFDDKTRAAVQDMLQKSKELTKKIQDSSSEDEDDEEAKEVIQKLTEGDAETGESADLQAEHILSSARKRAGGWLDGPTKYVYNKEQNSKGEDEGEGVDTFGSKSSFQTDQNDLESEEEPVSENVSVSKRNKRKRGAIEIEADDSNAENTSAAERLDLSVANGQGEKESSEEPKKKKKINKKNEGSKEIDSETQSPEQLVEDMDETAIIDELVALSDKMGSQEEQKTSEEPKKKKKKKKKKGDKGEVQEKLAAKPISQTTIEVVEEGERIEGERDEADSEDEDNMKVSMEELFQDEDFVEEFTKDKAELEARTRPIVEDVKLPGWGSWAGPDYKEMQKKKAEKRKKHVTKPSKEVKQPFVPYVWLNPNRDEEVRKLQPKKVPFPYTSVEQYEASLRQPVSRGFVRETASKLLTKPEVVTKLGHIIKPIDKEDHFGKKDNVEVDYEDKNFGGVAPKDKRMKGKMNKETKNKRRSLR